MKKISFYLICILFFLLPFSSWIVSLTGTAWVSLFRDLIVIALFFCVLCRMKFKFTPILFVALSFIALGLLTFFWREASVAQWMKGFRFIFIPIVMFISVSQLNFLKEEKNKIFTTVLVSGAIVLLLGLLQIFNIDIPTVTKYSNEGALAFNHQVGGDLKINRISSVLAGPNAFGLFLLAFLPISYIYTKRSKIALVLALAASVFLLLTFSRSAVIGGVIILLLALYIFLKKKYTSLAAIPVIALILATFIFSGLFLYNSSKYKNFVTHYSSSELRVEQYKRIWDTKSEIGFWGRGAGTAGPASQFRLDNGENHWTENIYLDIFEEYGYAGLLLYVCLVIGILFHAKKNLGQRENYLVYLTGFAFLITGIFINYYTGQVGIYLLWLISGLALQKEQSA